MEPRQPERSYELHNIEPPGATVGSETSEQERPTSSTRTNYIPQNTQPDRPKVRFNSREDAAANAVKAKAEHMRQPRPALSRNPNSVGSTAGDIADEPLNEERTASTVAAAHRAHVAAVDAHDDSINPSRRWSMDSEAPIARSYAPLAPTHEDTSPNAKATEEAEGLLKAHTQNFSSPLHHRLINSSRSNPMSNKDEEDTYVSSGNAKGGVFYQLLQAYRNPTLDSFQPLDKRARKDDTPCSSGTATPSRRKWYEQEKETRSQETLARLVGASAKLANPNEKTPFLSSPPELRKRHHKRTTSERLMSMMGMAQEDEVKITIHVADILKRQKYIVKMCKALMLFGAPTHRLEEYLAMAARVLEIDSQFLYIPGCMIISFDDVLTHTTEVKIVRTTQGVNLGKLTDVHDIYKEVLHDVISLDEALSRLDQVIKAENRYPVWVCVLMYGLASASVSCFFKARPIDMPIIFFMGMLLGFLQLVVAPRSNTYNTVFEVSAAILLSFLARAFGSIRNGNLFCFSALTQGSIAMILPGWLVLSSALELQTKAVVPGAIRLVYAIIYSLFLAYGITVGTTIYGAIDSNAVMETTCQTPMDPHWNFLFVPLYIFFVTFTVQAKWSQIPAMIVIALTGYTVNFFTAQRFAASPSIAYTFGAFTIGVLANLYSRVRHGVAAAVLLPAVYVQVPGSLASTGAITSGLLIASNITNPEKTTNVSKRHRSLFLCRHYLVYTHTHTLTYFIASGRATELSSLQCSC
ncbi:DUF1212-domain-containing protein [Poronia punctata]|nr:DUF1212-domain-containing protein [Poronia punctata]